MNNQNNTRIASAGAVSSSNSTVTPIIADDKASEKSALQRFIAQVLPADSLAGSYYAAAKNNHGKFKRAAFPSVSELTNAVAKSGATRNTWISMGKFEDGCKANNCVLKQGFYIDLDYGNGKGLKTDNEAISALQDAVKAGLPEPSLVISTGNGFHIHWILDKPISPEAWKPIAKKLQDFIDSDKGLVPLATDKCVTVDVARILRAPDTFNFKAEPKKVFQIHPNRNGDVTLFYNIEDFEKAVSMPAIPKAAKTASYAFLIRDPMVIVPSD